MSELLELLPKNEIQQNRKDTINEKIIKIQKVNKNDLTYNEFFHDYMNKNIPVVITSVSNNWKCRTQWINKTELNYNFLKSTIGNSKVPVADCSKIKFNAHGKIEMNFYDYLNYIKRKDLDFEPDDMLYLKDWHLKAQLPEYDFYKVPKYFASDWLNEFLVDTNNDDYRFVYIGPKGSWTPFHADVFMSYSWSTNIHGSKKWILLPPNEELKLKDSLGNFPINITKNILNDRHVEYFEIVQNENESLFVPSGWYHQVWNISEAISINHNWFNACNIRSIWDNLTKYMQYVVTEIDDCRSMDNFDEHCHIMLKASFGMNYQQFLEILKHITKKRIKYLVSDERLQVFGTYKFNTYHIIFDLKSIYAVLMDVKKDKFLNIHKHLIEECNKILKIIESEKIISEFLF